MSAVPPPAAGERTLLAEMLRPRSLGLLVLALLLAVIFAALGQWQLSRAVQAGTVVERPTETVRPLSAVAQPQQQQTDASIGQLVRTSGRFVPADFLVVSDRLNRGHRGYWVVAHAILDAPAGAQLAVAVGWTPTAAEARRAVATLRAEPSASRPLDGRYIDSDATEPSTSGPPNRLSAVATPQLLNLWSDASGPMYEGVLTLRAGLAGLTPIYSPRPEAQVELNWLNLFYAVEWALFALIAFYIWYRLVRDRWEQERAPRDDEEEPARAETAFPRA